MFENVHRIIFLWLKISIREITSIKLLIKKSLTGTVCVCVCVCVCVHAHAHMSDICICSGSINLTLTVFSSQQPYLYFYTTQSLLVIFPFYLKITIPKSAKHHLSFPFLAVKSLWHSARWTCYNNNGGLFWLIENLRRKHILQEKVARQTLIVLKDGVSDWYSLSNLSFGFTE